MHVINLEEEKGDSWTHELRNEIVEGSEPAEKCASLRGKNEPIP